MKSPADLKIAFFDTKPYDRESFERQNQSFGFKLKFFPSHLTEETVPLVQGYDAVCVFVNDRVTKGIIDGLAAFNVPLLALRSAGYNNIDLKDIVETGKILLVNLQPKQNRLSHENARLIGTLLISEFWEIARMRQQGAFDGVRRHLAARHVDLVAQPALQENQSVPQFGQIA